MVLKSRGQYNLFLENYPAFKGLMQSKSNADSSQRNFLLNSSIAFDSHEPPV